MNCVLFYSTQKKPGKSNIKPTFRGVFLCARWCSKKEPGVMFRLQRKEWNSPNGTWRAVSNCVSLFPRFEVKLNQSRNFFYKSHVLRQTRSFSSLLAKVEREKFNSKHIIFNDFKIIYFLTWHWTNLADRSQVASYMNDGLADPSQGLGRLQNSPS